MTVPEGRSQERPITVHSLVILVSEIFSAFFPAPRLQTGPPKTGEFAFTPLKF